MSLGHFGHLAAFLGLVILVLVIIKTVQLSRKSMTPGQARFRGMPRDITPGPP
jgi:hypothetical protein